MSKMTAQPTVSLGLPVYNGEKYISEAIESALSQTFTDFELIISDNASTDATRSICEVYAKKDPRICYVRQSTNIGAAENFNFVLRKSCGRYFKWCAHDDFFGPDFLAACVHHLDENLGAVGAFPKCVRLVDSTGLVITEGSADLQVRDNNGAVRFAKIAPKSRSIPIMSLFSLYRRDALSQTSLGSFQSSDRVLISEMLLYGNIDFLEKSYFAFRTHPEQYSARMMEGQDFCISWFDPKADGKVVFKQIQYVSEFLKISMRAKLSFRDRLTMMGGVGKLIFAQRRQLVKEMLVPLYRNGKLTPLGEKFQRIRKKAKARFRLSRSVSKHQ